MSNESPRRGFLRRVMGLGAAGSASVAPVSTSRYLSTNAATPRSWSHFATSVPSLCQERKRKPPPGQTMTAVPVARERFGRNEVSSAAVSA